MEGTLPALHHDDRHHGTVGDLVCDVAEEQVSKQWFIRRTDHNQVTVAFLRILQDCFQNPVRGFNEITGDMFVINTLQGIIEDLIPPDGDLEHAESIFGRLTGLNAGHVRRVLYGAEGRNLAIACRALGIEQLQFVSIFMLSRRLGLGEKALEPRRLTHIAGWFAQTDEAAARKTLNQWLCYSGD